MSVSSVVSQVASDEVSMQLIQIASHGAFSIGRRRILERKYPLPIGVLSDWIELVHPRLRPQARSSRLVALHDHLLRGLSLESRRVSDVTLRRFGDDFGEENSLKNGRMITLQSMIYQRQGIQSLLIWALNRPISQPLVLDVLIPITGCFLVGFIVQRTYDFSLLLGQQFR